MTPWRASSICLVLVACAARAEPQVRLVYERGPGAEACPSEEEMRSAVVGALGYSPFDDGAEDLLRVRLGLDQLRLRARIVLVHGDGDVGTKELFDQDCRALAEHAALDIVLSIDPFADPGPIVLPLPPPVPVQVVPPIIAVVPDEPTTTTTAPLQLGLSALVALNGAIGTAVGVPAAGLTLGARLRLRSLVLGLEARGDWPSNQKLAGGAAVDTTLVLLSATACLRSWWVVGCGVGSGGVFAANGSGFEDPRAVPLSPHGAVGARIGLEVPVGSGFHVVGAVEGSVPVTRVTLTDIAGAALWTTPRMAAGLSLGLAAELW